MSETASIQPPRTEPVRRGGITSWVRRRARDLAPFATLVVLVVFFSVSSDSFLNLINLRNILAQVSTLAVVSTGITFVLLCGEIDLSMGEVRALQNSVGEVRPGEFRPPDHLNEPGLAEGRAIGVG